jgi:hypothetical protein
MAVYPCQRLLCNLEILKCLGPLESTFDPVYVKGFSWAPKAGCRFHGKI